MALHDEKSGFDVAPYFDDLLARLEADEPVFSTAYGRHVHWGYWPDPSQATGKPHDYADAAEGLCRLVCDAAEIQDGMRILDVGCGIGGTIASLNDRFRNLELVGVNLDPRQLEMARRRVVPNNGNRIEFVEGDACKLDFPVGSFDAVLAVECIFHFESRADFLNGVGRVLKPHGRFALSDFVPTEEGLPILLKKNPADDPMVRLTYGKVDLLCPPRRYLEMATAAGLVLGANRNINEGTLPTYDFLRADFQARRGNKSAAVHARATARLEAACRMGWLQYSVLSFRRRAAALSPAA